jgi:hypothetical protein
MKILATPMAHAMAQIAAAGALPMQAKPLPINSHDDRATATIMAAEVMAAAKGEQNTWRGLAWRVIDVNTETREAFIKALKADKAAMSKGQTEAGIDKKIASARTASFGVRLSQMTTIAKAFNAGGTVAGLLDHVNSTLPGDKQARSEADLREHLGFVVIYEYAKRFTGSAGSKVRKTWLENLGKWLEQNPAPEGDDATEKVRAQFVTLYNTFVG